MIREKSKREIAQINETFRPILSDMSEKMNMLSKKYNINVSLKFDEITQEEVEK